MHFILIDRQNRLSPSDHQVVENRLQFAFAAAPNKVLDVCLLVAGESNKPESRLRLRVTASFEDGTFIKVFGRSANMSDGISLLIRKLNNRLQQFHDPDCLDGSSACPAPQPN